MAALVENKKVRLTYEILETLEAGIELLGLEVKSLREGRGKLEGARIVVRGNEAYLVGMQLPPYQPKNTPENYDQERTRKLLLTRTEISRLLGFESKKGLTIVPISMYGKARKIKVSIAVVRGKKLHDKRQDMKKREAQRDIGRSLKKEY